MLEFLKQPGIYECCFFVLGVFCYRTIASFLKLTVMYSFALSLSQTCQILITKTHEQLILANKIKEEALTKADTSQDLLEELVAEDIRTLNEWKTRTFDDLRKFMPDSIHDTIKEESFKDKQK